MRSRISCPRGEEWRWTCARSPLPSLDNGASELMTGRTRLTRFRGPSGSTQRGAGEAGMGRVPDAQGGGVSAVAPLGSAVSPGKLSVYPARPPTRWQPVPAPPETPPASPPPRSRSWSTGRRPSSCSRPRRMSASGWISASSCRGSQGLEVKGKPSGKDVAFDAETRWRTTASPPSARA